MLRSRRAHFRAQRGSGGSFWSSEDLSGPLPESPGSRRGRPELPRPLLTNQRQPSSMPVHKSEGVPGLGGLGLDRGSRVPGVTSFTIFTSHNKSWTRL